MNSLFLLGEQDRRTFLQQMMQSFDCTYICVWSYLPQPSNCLLYLDGLYREVSNLQQPSSSSGSLAQRLFNTYCESVNFVDNGRIPGFAFKNNLPYMELKSHDFQRMASSQVQQQFYQEAGIKTVVFMACATGEIELGISTDARVGTIQSKFPQNHTTYTISMHEEALNFQEDMESEMKILFPTDFSQQAASIELMIPQSTDQIQPPSSSSSSLRSLSVDSVEYSPLRFNIPTASLVQEPPKEGLIRSALLEEALKSSIPLLAPTSTSPHEQAIQALSHIRNIQFPTIEGEDAAMTKAILAVLSSSPSTSSSSQQLNLPPVNPVSHNATAFSRYREALAPARDRTRKHNMFRRAVSFFRDLNIRRRQELHIQGNRPSSTQLHHMISERRRREKLNESFQILRSLLPPGSKKDKASVLSNTTEYLSSLKSQVAELVKRIQLLEAQSSTKKEATMVLERESSSSERLNVEIEHVSSSTSEARFLDLRVTLRGECSLMDFVIRILEFLKQQRNLSLLSTESNTRIVESTQVHGILLRLRIEGDELDESSFQEAVKRVLEDMT